MRKFFLLLVELNSGQIQLIKMEFEITSLDKNLHLLNQTISLVEKSFKYPSHQLMKIDFAPLWDERFLIHNYILINKNQVIAHIGMRIKKTQFQNICLIGGIAIDPEYQGKGLFRDFFSQLLTKHQNDCSCFVLWSEKKELYSKFDFHLGIPQKEFHECLNEEKFYSNFFKTKYSLLSHGQKKEIQYLYNSQSKIIEQIYRTEHDWEVIDRITSSDLYFSLNNNKKIDCYFFKNKGHDLKNYIHECAFTSEESKKKLFSALLKSNFILPFHPNFNSISGAIRPSSLVKKTTLIASTENKDQIPLFISGLDSI